MDKFKNKYRIPSARLQSWDYGANGAYFITICTQNRKEFFGKMLPAKEFGVSTMQLNEMGQLAEKYWMEIPHHFPFIELGNFVVMPNHTHGILIIDKMDRVTNDDTIPIVLESREFLVSKTIGQMRFQNQGKNTTSSIVGSYKSVVTKNARLIDPNFGWQTRFHDHIIRDAKSFENIQNYIANNPANWGKNKFQIPESKSSR